MKAKLLNLGLILTSFIGYLEWGGNNRMFLIQGEIEVVSKLLNDPLSAFHPFTVLPMIGQVLLVTTLFQGSPSKLLTYLGMCGIGILLLFMLIIGLIGPNIKTALSVLPFVCISIMVVRHHQSIRSGQEN